MAVTPKEIFEDRIAQSIEDDPDKVESINAVYQFEIDGPNGGTWTVDMKEGEVYAGEADDAPDVTIHCSDDDFVAIAEGDLNGMQAFMEGKLRVDGDMALAMKLQEVLS
jgi:putative sterol carrier protein